MGAARCASISPRQIRPSPWLTVYSERSMRAGSSGTVRLALAFGRHAPASSLPVF